MQITIELPDDLALHEAAAREVLEAFVAEAYRTESLTDPQCCALLGLDRFGFYDWRKAKGLTRNFYDVEDLLDDVKTGDALRASGLLPS